MRAVKQLGRVVLGVLVISAGPIIANAKMKQAADEDSDLESRVQALEKKVDAAQQTDSTENKSLTDRVAAIEGDVKATKDSIADKLGLSIHGFVGASYNYNFNKPDSKTNQLNFFMPEANTFELDQANLNISRKKEDSNLGFVVNLDFGETAKILGNGTAWQRGGADPTRNEPIELREAFLTYKIPIGDGITLKGGKFATLLGEEIIDNFDNHNPNISRSISFGYGIPLTNTGFMASVPVGSLLNFDMAVVNGWDNVIDNNSGKTFMGGIGINPADMLSIYISGIYGPEQTDHSGARRAATTTVATLKPTDMVTLVGEFTYGNEEKAKFSDPTKDAEWYGGAGYVIVQATDALGFSLRGEVFDDTDGSRFLLTSNGATAWEVTPTVSYKVTDGLLWRTEYRHDNADKKIFDHEGNANNGQDQITTQLIYSF